MNDRIIKTIDAWRERGTFLDDLKKCTYAMGAMRNVGKVFATKSNTKASLFAAIPERLNMHCPAKGSENLHDMGNICLR